jgi:hypothetical protein
MTGQLVQRSRLTSDQQLRMFEILSHNFDHITVDRFTGDLADKNWVILIRDDDQRIVGFSTLLLYATLFDGSPVAVVYSGDTIIERDAWGSAALPRTWIHSVWELHARECPQLPLYWFLLTGGYRTYRFLSVFWRKFYPSCEEETPERPRRLLHQLASDKFGPRFNPTTGVVSLGQPLCAELRDVPPGKRTDPHVSFFLQRNPEYVRGDELACLCELSRDNLTPAGWRMVNPSAAPAPAPARP